MFKEASPHDSPITSKGGYAADQNNPKTSTKTTPVTPTRKKRAASKRENSPIISKGTFLADQNDSSTHAEKYAMSPSQRRQATSKRKKSFSSRTKSNSKSQLQNTITITRSQKIQTTKPATTSRATQTDIVLFADDVHLEQHSMTPENADRMQIAKMAALYNYRPRQLLPTAVELIKKYEREYQIWEEARLNRG